MMIIPKMNVTIQTAALSVTTAWIAGTIHASTAAMKSADAAIAVASLAVIFAAPAAAVSDAQTNHVSSAAVMGYIAVTTDAKTHFVTRSL